MTGVRLFVKVVSRSSIVNAEYDVNFNRSKHW